MASEINKSECRDALAEIIFQHWADGDLDWAQCIGLGEEAYNLLNDFMQQQLSKISTTKEKEDER